MRSALSPTRDSGQDVAHGAGEAARSFFFSSASLTRPQYVSNKFTMQTKSTIGSDFLSKGESADEKRPFFSPEPLFTCVLPQRLSCRGGR